MDNACISAGVHSKYLDFLYFSHTVDEGCYWKINQLSPKQVVLPAFRIQLKTAKIQWSDVYIILLLCCWWPLIMLNMFPPKENYLKNYF